MTPGQRGARLAGRIRRMRAGPVLAISSLVHVALLAIVVPANEAPLTPFVVPQLPARTAPAAPIVEVALLDDTSASVATSPGVATAAIVVGPARRGAGASTAAVQTSPGTAHDEVGTAKGAASGIMHMRGGVDLGLETAIGERLAAEPGHRAQEPYKTGRVERHHDGTAVVDDAVTKMNIDRDGNVHLHDKADIDIHFHLPVPTFHFDIDEARHELGKAITEWYADPYKMTRYGPTADLPEHLKAVQGACDQYDSIWCEDPNAPDYEKRLHETKKQTGSMASGKADFTAYLMRKLAHADPYASRKLKLLDDTRDERVDMGGAYRAKHLEESREIMRKNLLWLWQETKDPAARRQTLFEMWDECAEGEGPMGEAGERARVVVIDWIREHLPAGSPDAYSADEVARLCAKRSSKQPFAPY